MEVPKNYSEVYREDKPPVPATRGSTKLDGAFAVRRHRESAAGGIDPNDLLKKLFTISKDQQKCYAMGTLQKHYSNCFQKGNRQIYKVCIDYYSTNGQQQERYLVKVDRNSLRDVKNKLPIKGDYRLFFIHSSNECEEVDDDDSPLPYHEKDGTFIIYCRAFAK